MGRRNDRDRDDRPSWRDIDRKREGSRHTDQNRPADGHHESSNRYYKAALEKAMKKRLEDVFADPVRDGLAKKIREATTGAERKEAAQEYLDKYDLPDDFETLMALAEVKDDAIFARVIPVMAEQWSDQPASRRKVAKQMLQMRLMRVRDKDARAIAQDLIKKG